MKRELSREKKQETEKYLSVMEDLNVVLALLILLLAAIFLMDISGYGLMLALAALAFLCFSLYLWQVLF